MTPRKTDDELLDGRHLRRLKSEDRLLARWEQQERDAAPYIGELCRDGATVYYIFPCERRYREAASRTALVEFLVRNRYI